MKLDTKQQITALEYWYESRRDDQRDAVKTADFEDWYVSYCTHNNLPYDVPKEDDPNLIARMLKG